MKVFPVFDIQILIIMSESKSNFFATIIVEITASGKKNRLPNQNSRTAFLRSFVHFEASSL